MSMSGPGHEPKPAAAPGRRVPGKRYPPLPAAEFRRRAALTPDPDAPVAALFEALDRDDTAAAAELLARGANINAPDPRTPLYDGQTVLISAANRGTTGLLRWLLACGADVNARSASGWTALMRACNNSDTEAARTRTRRRSSARGRAGIWDDTAEIEVAIEALVTWASEQQRQPSDVRSVLVFNPANKGAGPDTEFAVALR